MVYPGGASQLLSGLIVKTLCGATSKPSEITPSTMTSTAGRPSNESGSSGTTFSYAQAAKGRAPSATGVTMQASQDTSGVTTPSKESNSGSSVGLGYNEADGAAVTNGDVMSKSVSTMPESDLNSINSIPSKSSPSSPSIGSDTTPTLPKGDESAFMSRMPVESPWDRPSQQETQLDRSVEPTERRKGRKGKKDKTSEKEAEPVKEEVKPEVLVAAPPPAVNIWQQRMKAEAAKGKNNSQNTDSSTLSAEDSNVNGVATSSASKAAEFKKKGRVNSDEFERTTSFGQNSGAKEQATSTKTPKKGFETNGRSKEESISKRPTPRGSRMSEKEEKSTGNNLPPPVEDAVSWPTPDTALEEKRKVQEKVEKEEKEDGGSNKPRQKEKWLPVPYIPSVTFNTPLPARGRGGRGGGGTRAGSGRGNHGPNGSISGDRAFSSATTSANTAAEPRERGRDSVSAGRATSLPPNSSKRATGDTPYSSHDQRKPSISVFDKTKGDLPSQTTRTENHSSRDNRRSSITAHAEPFSPSNQDVRQSLGDFSRSGKGEMPNGTSSEGHSQSRSAGIERRSEPNIRMNEFTKEVNGHGQPRERGEGRPERGRGGYRGRGGHASFPNGQPHNQHPFTNGHPSQTQNSFGLRQNGGPYSPPLQQQQYPTAYPTPSRTGRGGPPRGQSIPNNGIMYSRFPPNVVSGAQMPPLQAVNSVYEYPGMQALSTAPYNPYLEQPYTMIEMVINQLEYYFSIDNLCKDVFLRKHMDSKGFVYLSTIAKFKRIQSLTQEFELLRHACQQSEIIDIVMGEDGIDRIRRQDGWEKWVLAMEDRDEIARNDGPERYYRLQIPVRPQQMPPRMMTAPQSAISPTSFSPNGVEPNFPPYSAALAGPNGTDHSNFYQTESPLSAAVPEFSPGSPPKLPNELDAETTFTDEEVDNLQLVYNHKGPSDAKPKSAYHNASSRTFSNGSIDARSISEELVELQKRQSRPLTNGDSSSHEM